MLEVLPMTEGHEYWNALIDYADACSWQAGPALAKAMRENAFSGWERVFILRDRGEIAGFCTFAAKDELAEGYDFTPFIGFVFVGEPFRGSRLSEFMIRCVLSYAGERGFEKVYLMSGEKGLYEKYGFEKLGDYPTIFGTVDQLFVISAGAAKCD